MTEEDRYVEIYKLHSELADHVSQRREGANRLYVSVVGGLVVFLAALVRFGGEPFSAIIFLVSLGGVLLSLSWYGVLQSYRQLNNNKFRVLHRLEREHLPFQFFVEEWDPEASGAKTNDYRRLTKVEASLPIIFVALFVGIAVYVGLAALGHVPPLPQACEPGESV